MFAGDARTCLGQERHNRPQDDSTLCSALSATQSKAVRQTSKLFSHFYLQEWEDALHVHTDMQQQLSNTYLILSFMAAGLC